MISNILKYHAAKGPKKWVLWVVISLVASVTLLALYMRLNKRQAELRKLRINAELTDQKSEQLRFDVMREKDTVKLADMLRQAQILQKAAEAQRAEIVKNEKEFNAEYKQVKALESWKDLDAYNRKSRS